MSTSAIQILGFVAGICTGVSMLPQLIKVIREKQAGDISVLMLLILLAGLGLWVTYGILIKDIPIAATNSFSFLVNLVLLFFRLRYRNKK